MKNVLVTGANGQLGCSLRSSADQHPLFTFFFTDIDTLDICDREAVVAYVTTHHIDYIINAAAYTAVDKAETEEELANRINHQAVHYLGEAAKMGGAKVVHISTDYVFNGKAYHPYTEEDQVGPVSVYGCSKLAGENILREVCPDHLIIRTAWLYSEYGNNFVKTMLRLGAERTELNVVFDQIGTPTYAGDFAKAILYILDKSEEGGFIPGVYHYSNEGVCSWYDFARKIMELGNLACAVNPIETKDYPTPAIRPAYSVLNKTKIKETYGLSIPHWEESLKLIMNYEL